MSACCCFTPTPSATLRNLPEIPIFNSKLPMEAQFYTDIRPPRCREYYLLCCFQYCPLVANGYCLWCNTVSDLWCPDNIFTLVKGVEVGILDNRVYRREDPLQRYRRSNDDNGDGGGGGLVTTVSSSNKKAPLLVAVKILRGRTFSNASNPSSSSSSYMSTNQQSEDSESQLIEKTGFLTLEHLDIACCFDITNATLNLPIVGTVNESLDIRKEADVALDERMITTATHRYPHIYRACNGSMLAFVVILTPGDKVQLLSNEVQFLGDLKLPDWKNYVVKAKVIEIQDERLKGLIGSLCWVNVEDFDCKQYLDRQNLLMHIPSFNSNNVSGSSIKSSHVSGSVSGTDSGTGSSGTGSGSDVSGGLSISLNNIYPSLQANSSNSSGSSGGNTGLHSPTHSGVQRSHSGGISNNSSGSSHSPNKSASGAIPIPQSPSHRQQQQQDPSLTHSPPSSSGYKAVASHSPNENKNINVHMSTRESTRESGTTKATSLVPPPPPPFPEVSNRAPQQHTDVGTNSGAAHSVLLTPPQHLQVHFVSTSSSSSPHRHVTYLCEGSTIMVQQTIITSNSNSSGDEKEKEKDNKTVHSSFCFDTAIVGTVSLIRGQFAIRVTLKAPFVYTVLSSSSTSSSRTTKGKGKEAKTADGTVEAGTTEGAVEEEEEQGQNSFVLDFNTEMDRNRLMTYLSASQQYQLQQQQLLANKTSSTPIESGKSSLSSGSVSTGASVNSTSAAPVVPVVPVPIPKRKKGSKRRSRSKPLTTLMTIPEEEPASMHKLPADHDDSDDDYLYDTATGVGMDTEGNQGDINGIGSRDGSLLHNNSAIDDHDDDEEESRPLSSMIEY